MTFRMVRHSLNRARARDNGRLADGGQNRRYLTLNEMGE
jgi:hypothetical protein